MLGCIFRISRTLEMLSIDNVNLQIETFLISIKTRPVKDGFLKLQTPKNTMSVAAVSILPIHKLLLWSICSFGTGNRFGYKFYSVGVFVNNVTGEQVVVVGWIFFEQLFILTGGLTVDSQVSGGWGLVWVSIQPPPPPPAHLSHCQQTPQCYKTLKLVPKPVPRAK